MSITVEMRTQVSQLYVSLFGRAPDGEGLGYWVGQLADGKTIAAVAQEMFSVTPARAIYPSYMTNDEIVAAFYVNVLGRTADAEGQAFWVGKMNATGATKGSVIADMINVVANYTGTDAAGLKSKALFTNKVEVAQYYGEKNGSIAGATTALAGVTEVATTVTTAKAAVDAGANPGQTFTLSTDADLVSGSDLDDTITGGLGTLGTDDEIDGGDGEDTMTVRMDAEDAMGVVSNVETIEIVARGAGTADFVDVSGMTNLVLRDGNSGFTLTNFDQSTASLTLENADDIITVGFDDVEGEADELALTVDGFDGDLTVGTGLESVAITASGEASDFTLTDDTEATITDITIEGSVDVTLTLDVEADAVETIDGSAATGDNTYDVSAVELDITLTAGSGEDTLTFDTRLNTSDVIDGGEGDDTLTAEVDAASTVRPTMSNVESIELDFSAAGTFDARNVTGLTSLEFAGITADATVTRLESTVTALSITEGTTTTEDISVTYASGADTAVTLSIGATDDEGDAVADVGDITIAGNDGALTISSGGDDDNLVDAVTADDAASLTINATTNALTTTTISAASAASLTINATAGDVETTTIAAADATTFTLNATGGDITVTNATLTAATDIALNATGGAITTDVLTTDADAAEVTVVADGEAAVVTIAQIAADFATAFDFTATEGGEITVTDIVTVGLDSDGEAIANEISLSATGVDGEDAGSDVSVTIADLADGVIDLVTLDSDADGSVSFTVTADSGGAAEVTEVDATASEGTTTIDLSGLDVAAEVSTGAGGSTTTLTSDADTFVGGEGDDVVTGGDGADDITLGAGSDTVVFDTDVTADTIQDFNAEDDLIQVSVEIGTDLVDGSGTDLVEGATVVLQSQASDATADIATTTSILVFTDDIDNAADMITALEALEFAAAGDATYDFLVLWTDGSDTFLSSVELTVDALVIDDAVNSTIATLVGVTIGDLAAANFALVV